MSSEYGELVGFDNAHFAKVLEDSDDRYQAAGNAYLAPGGEIKHEAKTDITPRYYDNKPMFTSVSEAATEVTTTVSGVPMKLASQLTGKPYDATKGILLDTGDASNTPDCAFSGRMDLGDGGYRYFQYLKGKFSVGTQQAKTKEDKTTVNTTDLTYTAMATIHQFTTPDGLKSLKGLFADTTDPAFAGADAWFAQVQTPDTLGAPGVLSMTAVPANNATGVAAGVHPALTFSNAVAENAVTLIQADGTLVEITKSYDSTGKVLTLTPADALETGEAYTIIIAGVKDVYGQTLATAAVKFTVA